MTAPALSTDLALVSRATAALLRRTGLAVRWRDPDGAEVAIAPELAASPLGLLPVFVVAGEAVWREATGRGFALAVARDPAALLGYRLERIGAGGYAAVMLATMEAAARAARGTGAILAGDLGPVWSEALRAAPDGPAFAPPPRASAGPGAAP